VLLLLQRQPGHHYQQIWNHYLRFAAAADSVLCAAAQVLVDAWAPAAAALTPVAALAALAAAAAAALAVAAAAPQPASSEGAHLVGQVAA
jgi:hypothetical protein